MSGLPAPPPPKRFVSKKPPAAPVADDETAPKAPPVAAAPLFAHLVGQQPPQPAAVEAPAPSPPPQSADQSLVQQLRTQVAELSRENAMLHRRLKAFVETPLPPVSSAVPGMPPRPFATADDVDAETHAFAVGDGAALDGPPVSLPQQVKLLRARVRRLELALQLECLERDELETLLAAKSRVITKLVAQANQ